IAADRNLDTAQVLARTWREPELTAESEDISCGLGSDPNQRMHDQAAGRAPCHEAFALDRLLGIHHASERRAISSEHGMVDHRQQSQTVQDRSEPAPLILCRLCEPYRRLRWCLRLRRAWRLAERTAAGIAAHPGDFERDWGI